MRSLIFLIISSEVLWILSIVFFVVEVYGSVLSAHSCVVGSSPTDSNLYLDHLYQEIKFRVMKMEFNSFPGNSILYSNILRV